MELLVFRIATLLVGSALAGVQDAKTGLISDKISYAMMAIGILLNIAEFNWLGLGLGFAVFAIGYLAYYLGKIGGGDVKLFTGISFLLPFYSEKIFVLGALFFSAIFAVVFYSIFFIIKYARIGIDWEENRQGIVRGAFLAILFFVCFWLLWQAGSVSEKTVFLFSITILFGCIFVALEKGIRKNFFLKKIRIKEAEEDEVIAMDCLDEKTKKALGLKAKGILGKKEIEKLGKAGIKEILVYRNMPPFAPFIFLAIITVLAKIDFDLVFI